MLPVQFPPPLGVLGGCLQEWAARSLKRGLLYLPGGQVCMLGARQGVVWEAGWGSRPALCLTSIPAQGHCALSVQGRGEDSTGTQPLRPLRPSPWSEPLPAPRSGFSVVAILGKPSPWLLSPARAQESLADMCSPAPLSTCCPASRLSAPFLSPQARVPMSCKSPATTGQWNAQPP